MITQDFCYFYWGNNISLLCTGIQDNVQLYHTLAPTNRLGSTPSYDGYGCLQTQLEYDLCRIRCITTSP